ncbi:MAG: Na+ dependent nucleoside transporter [Aureispira sp.]|nr:Na+ dependent nucleoside transporter [Aureispira sp.]
MDILRGILGIAVLLGILFLFSANKKRIDWKLVGMALGVQVILGLSILKIDAVRNVFDFISSFFVAVIGFTKAGSDLVFGGMMDTGTVGYIFAVQVLPTIIFFSALSAVLYYLGILQRIIYGMAFLMTKVMRLTGAESLAAAANVFIGQTEAPLIIKPYLDRMSKSELLCLMVGGMATIAGGVLAAYIGFLGGDSPEAQQEFATHLLTASIMSAPAAILAAKMLYPEDNEEINRSMEVPKDQIADNLLDAISRGTTDGLKLAVNVGAMLIVFTALMAMLNSMCSSTLGAWISWTSDTGQIVTLNDYVTELTGGRFAGFNLEYLLGIFMSPIAWVLGTPTQDMLIMGQLLGKKTILNEFVAYADIPSVQHLLTEKSKIIATYALCGFANFASIGIQLGGIGAIAPNRRKELSEFGIKALIGGTIACFLTATIAGMMVG